MTRPIVRLIEGVNLIGGLFNRAFTVHRAEGSNSKCSNINKRIISIYVLNGLIKFVRLSATRSEMHANEIFISLSLMLKGSSFKLRSDKPYCPK